MLAFGCMSWFPGKTILGIEPCASAQVNFGKNLNNVAQKRNELCFSFSVSHL